MDLRAIKQELYEILGTRPDRRILATLTPPNDVGDIAGAVADKEAAARRLDHNHTKRVQAREALTQLESGRYGECIACEEPIERERLGAVPWTVFCIGCAEKLEEGSLPGFERFEEHALRTGCSIHTHA